MKLIGASFVFLCDDEFSILKDGGVVYENEVILEVGKFSTLKSKYDLNDKNATFHNDCVLLPAFVNAHIHFEFGANDVSFNYGGFDLWLTSVMQKREGVLGQIENVLDSGIQSQLKSGVGSVGAISSYGGDLKSLASSPLKVVYFNEAIGSNPSAIDTLFADFKARYELSKAKKSKTFFPAIAIHSPYSVHKILASRVIDIAKQDNALLSTHFLESKLEREWLTKKSGWFFKFYKNILQIPNPKPLYHGIKDFLGLFKSQTLFVHLTNAIQKEILQIADLGHYIVTCPRSNRLLDGEMLDINILPHSHLAIGSDGMSSNATLSMLDEIRFGLFGMRTSLLKLARILLLSATKYGAKALRLNNGTLEPSKDSDFALFHIANITKSTQPEVHFILHSKSARQVFINGECVFDSCESNFH